MLRFFSKAFRCDEELEIPGFRLASAIAGLGRSDVEIIT
jgi:hypothetical protein